MWVSDGKNNGFSFYNRGNNFKESKSFAPNYKVNVSVEMWKSRSLDSGAKILLVVSMTVY